MVEWFNEWQSLPAELEVTREHMISFLKGRCGIHLVRINHIEDDRLKWLFFFGSMFRGDNGSFIPMPYNIWIRKKMNLYDDSPGMGLNTEMAGYISYNYNKKFQEPFDRGAWEWHTKIMFVSQDSPPHYPPLRGSSDMIPFINWMWESPFTFK